MCCPRLNRSDIQWSAVAIGEDLEIAAETPVLTRKPANGPIPRIIIVGDVILVGVAYDFSGSHSVSVDECAI